MNRFKTPVMAMFILLSLSSLAVLGPRPVQATAGGSGTIPCRPPDVCVLPTPWAPYGPQINTLRFQYYPGDTAEISAFRGGQLDLIDTALPPTLWLPFNFNPDFNLSPSQPNNLFYGVYFNYGSSTWAAWGCDWQHGNNPCGIEIREAFAHLIDKARFISDGPLQGGAVPIADDVPGTMLLPNGTVVATPTSTQCQWDTIPVHQSPCIGAFNIAPDAGGFAQPGSPDFCAAVDHLVQAAFYAPGLGLRRDPSNTCAIDPTSPGLPNIVAHPMRAIVRTSEPRRTLGFSFANAINQLFAGNTVNIIRRFPGFCLPFSAVDCWDWYTFGFQVYGPFPFAALYDTYDAKFICPPTNPTCYTTNFSSLSISSLDSALEAGVSTGDATVAYNDALTALNIMGSHAADIPIYNTIVRTAALTAVANPVNMLGEGFSNQWTYLYASKSSYVPVNPLYAFDGGSDPFTLRSGQSGTVYSLNPYLVQYPWELNLISEVYDTLFAENPTVPPQVFCWICSSFSNSLDSQGDTHFLVELRQNLRFHDGVPVDAKDVKFSLLTQRDLAYATGGAVTGLVSIRVVASNLLDIEMLGQAVDQLADLSTVPIIPRHIWELPGDHTYGDVGTVDPAKLDPSYDPVASGTFIGSGPFTCSSIFPEDLGRVGTGCTANSDGTRGGQAIDFFGGTATLTKFDRTSETGNTDPFLQWFRSFNPAWGTTGPVKGLPCPPNCFPASKPFSGQFQEFSWADRFDNATVTVQDLASVAACFGKSDPSGCADYSYWLRSAFHPSTPSTVTIEVTIVASHVDDTWVYPFSWNGNQSMQPGQQILGVTPFTP